LIKGIAVSIRSEIRNHEAAAWSSRERHRGQRPIRNPRSAIRNVFPSLPSIKVNRAATQ